MKKIFLLLLISFTFFYAYTQQITPAVTTEQCPGVNITFTVTIAAQSIQSVQSKAFNVPPQVIQQQFNILPNSGNITFNFIGKFVDNNNKQTFTLFYTNASNLPATFDFTFIKIKSLLLATSFSQVYPAPISITSPPCQITNHNISFANIQYGNPWESPQIGYGTITTYEYLLPNGWILTTGTTSTTSNGSNWIAGTNNVTVTSNLTTGGTIQVRASNPCGAALEKGQISTVSISRPKPPLTFVAPNPICSSAVYSASNIPSVFSSVNWSSTPAGLVSISPQNTPSTTITRLTNGLGTIDFTISAPGCTSAFTYNTQEITGSSQLITGQSSSVTGISMQDLTVDCYTPRDRYTAVGGVGATRYKWYKKDLSVSNPTFILQQDGPNNYYDVTGGRPGKCFDIEVKVEASNNCNTNTPVTFTKASEQCRCAKGDPPNGFSLTSVSPNPSSNLIQVELLNNDDSKEALTEIRQIRIIDKLGNIKKEIAGNRLKKMQLNIAFLSADIYTISVFDGKKWSNIKFSKL